MEAFESLLGKDSHLFQSIKDRGFEAPSEIQEKSIPAILEGNDVIAGASTGSGKTLAFAAGLINNIDAPDGGIRGLVLTPTRELAEQVAEQLSDFSKYKDLRVIPVYGGVSIGNQIRQLSSTDIVVGTPGRILDHINRRSINLSKVNTLVLDAADRMLDMGFINDVEKIIRNCPKNRQTLLFSATISQDIVFLAQRYMSNPLEISAEPNVDPEKLEQVYYDVPDGMKYSLLVHHLKNEQPKLAIIFCNTRRNVDFVANNLKFEGIEALPIHGGYSQDKRNQILEQFNSNKFHVLVATDVAARGLDIKGVTHIYNYDLPPTAKEYTHRIGRTARAGEEGKVINILASRDYENFNNILQGEFKIDLIETPYIERVSIRWMPDRGRSSRGRPGMRRNYSDRGHSSRDGNYSDRQGSRAGNYSDRGHSSRGRSHSGPRREHSEGHGYGRYPRQRDSRRVVSHFR